MGIVDEALQESTPITSIVDEALAEPKPESTVKKFFKGETNVITPIPEAITSIGTSLIGMGAGRIENQLARMRGATPEEADILEEETAQKYTYEPRTEFGKHLVDKVGSVLHPLMIPGAEVKKSYAKAAREATNPFEKAFHENAEVIMQTVADILVPAKVGKAAKAVAAERGTLGKPAPETAIEKAADRPAEVIAEKPTEAPVEVQKPAEIKPVPARGIVEEALAEPATPKTETTGTLKQSVMEGMSEAETLGLTPSAGEVGTPAPKGVAQKTVDWTRDLVNENPIFQQVEDMKKSGGLNRDSLLIDYDADTVKEISRRNPGLIKKEGGFGYDDMAAQLGYDSGDALVNALVDKPTKKAAAKQIRDEFNASPQGQAAAVARKGYTPLKEPVVAGDLNKGDALLIDGEKFSVKGEKKGRVTLKDGKTISVDVFDPITAEGIRRKQAGFEELAAQESAAQARGSFSLVKKGQTPAPAIVTFDKAIEQRFAEAKGKPQEGPLTRFKDFMTDIGHKMSRSYEHLPRTGEFAEAQFALKRLEKQKDVTSQRAVIEQADILAGLDEPKYDLFTRKVILDDLVGEAQKGRKLPFGFTPETLNVERVKVNAALSQHPEVQAALEKRRANWKRLKDEYNQAMQDIGFDVSDRLTNENYFRHQVIEYADANRIYGTGKKLKTPASRGFLKKREGSARDINTDYLEAEFEVYGQMMHDIEIARSIKRIDDRYNIAARVRREAKAKGYEDWRQAIPEGYTTWQPREGNVFYMADTIPAKLAEKLYSGELAEIGITEADIRKSMAAGGKRREFVIKQELADTLDNLGKQHQPGIITQADRSILKGWKVWQLISPRRVIKYNLRNLTGDADASFVGNPSGFSKVPQAVRDLWDVYVGKKPMSPEMQSWFDRGGMSATLQANEISGLKELWPFQRLYKEHKGVADIPKEAWHKYWKAARLSTDFREGILRYANYLDYLDQVRKSPEGKPRNFGASIPEEIMGLKDPVDRAYWLSNDLLGAYDRVSVFGQSMREHVFPFWSWKEVNMKRYKQFIQNAINDGNLAQSVGRKALGAAAKSPYVALKVGGFLIKATAFWSMLQVWNHLKFPEEEKGLSEEIKQKPHIILGRDKNGDIIYFNRIGALGDILEWFGLDAAPKQVDKWLKGKATLQEIAKEMGEDAAKGPLNVIASGSVPFAKLALETATRRSTFPDVTKPTTIRDRGLHLARSFGLENEFIAATGKPSKGYPYSVGKMVAYSVDPLEGSYRDVFELKSEFLKKLGKSAEGFWLTPKGDALYNMKLALRYGDNDAFAKYAGEYLQLGGTREGMTDSLKRMEPLGGMNSKEKAAFVASLKPDDQEKVARAYKFFQHTLLGEKAANERRQ